MLISFPFLSSQSQIPVRYPVRTEPRFPSAEGLWYMAPREDNYRLKNFTAYPLFRNIFRYWNVVFRPCIFIKCRNIMIHHQDNRFSHTSLPGPEGVRTAGIHALLLKFLFPFFFQLSLFSTWYRFRPEPFTSVPLETPSK